MSPQENVRAFRESHGALETWDAVDFEVHEHLVLIALATNEDAVGQLTASGMEAVA